MKVLTPLKAIRARCLDCCCGQPKEVRACTAQKCPLYPYRLGHRPKMGTDTPNTLEREKSTASPAVFAENTQ